MSDNFVDENIRSYFNIDNNIESLEIRDKFPMFVLGYGVIRKHLDKFKLIILHLIVTYTVNVNYKIISNLIN